VADGRDNDEDDDGYWWWQSKAGKPEKWEVPQWEVLAANMQGGVGSRTEESGSERERRE
jgi:hypothetical protein